MSSTRCHCGSKMVKRRDEIHCAATLATFKARHGYEYAGGPTVHVETCRHGMVKTDPPNCSYCRDSQTNSMERK